MKKLITVIFSFLIFQQNASAALLLEPYLGYHAGKIDLGGESNISGLSFGARVGYQDLGLMLGLDAMTGVWSDSASSSNADDTPKDYGFFVGYNFPVMMRVYGAYGFSSDLERKRNNATTDFSGSFMKFGVGFTMLPLVSLNLEYLSHSYDEANSNSLSTEVDTKLYGVTISVPLEF